MSKIKFPKKVLTLVTLSLVACMAVLFTACAATKPDAAVVLVIGSSTDERFTEMKKSAVDMVESFSPYVDISFGIVLALENTKPISFSNKRLSSDRDEVISTIQGLSERSWTQNLYSGIAEAQEILKDYKGPKNIVIISEGVCAEEKTIEKVRDVLQSDIELFAASYHSSMEGSEMLSSLFREYDKPDQCVHASSQLALSDVLTGFAEVITGAAIEAATYTVTFVDWNGAVLETQAIIRGNAAVAPEDPTREGYTFIDWDTTFSTVTSDLTVKAQYVYGCTLLGYYMTSILTDYNLSLEMICFENDQVYSSVYMQIDGDRALTAATYYSGDDDTVYVEQSYVEVSDPSYKYSHTLSDGYSLDSQTGEWYSVGKVISIAQQMKMLFEFLDPELYNVTKNCGSHVYTLKDSVTLPYYSDASIAATMKSLTLTLKDAYSGDVYYVLIFTLGGQRVENPMFVATYTVTFVDWDGAVIDTQAIVKGNAASAPADLTRTGYTFIGWDTGFSDVTSDLTVTAQYQINTYNVTFVDWDGAVLKTEKLDYGSSATAPTTDPTRTGYTFTGWSTVFSNVTSNLTVTAQYKINTYTVTFVDWDGTVLKTGSVNYGSSAVAPTTNPTRTGYTFTGWNVGFSNVTSNLTVTAQYKINTYTVTFVDWDGTVLKTQKLDHGSSATAPATEPTRTGYIFIGWSIAFLNVTANLTVTAEYEKKPDAVVILCIANSGTIPLDQWTAAKNAAIAMVESFSSDVDVSFGIVLHSNSAEPILFPNGQYLSYDRAMVISAIHVLTQHEDPYSLQNLYSGIVESQKLLDSYEGNGPKSIVIISNFYPNEVPSEEFPGYDKLNAVQKALFAQEATLDKIEEVVGQGNVNLFAAGYNRSISSFFRSLSSLIDDDKHDHVQSDLDRLSAVLTDFANAITKDLIA